MVVDKSTNAIVMRTGPSPEMAASVNRSTRAESVFRLGRGVGFVVMGSSSMGSDVASGANSIELDMSFTEKRVDNGKSWVEVAGKQVRRVSILSVFIPDLYCPSPGPGSDPCPVRELCLVEKCEMYRQDKKKRALCPHALQVDGVT